ncbi:MAG: alanine racemase [Candidatus Latescibacterota bacterium]|jgi:D-serine deaminase-like pyridoxal phosphate-dependent protein|nr:alanine racemase [Candidatus Latescibacterota bacterium]MEC8989752.1 alanine racemase [Candidatus Latescibacterota bacterium]MEE3042455.1 alanine racemase [Candidatus Latescibacterota bacterium]MEE3261564.1 alanine racemase [Candidatus Latescibacterota bacterium]
MNVKELDTPSLCVDIDVLDRNITNLQSACDELGIPLRVHTKTHKTPAIAQRQMAAGAIGIVAQKLGEAEPMAAAGIPDILVPYNIVGAAKLSRLVQLVGSEQTQLTVAADSEATVEGISAAMAAANLTVRMVVEMDTGSHRCGTQSPEETIALAQVIDQAPGTEFLGVMTYPSNERVRPFLDEVRQRASAAGLELQVISGGGTGSQEISKSLGCTETRIGSYAWEGMTRVGKREDLDPTRCPLRLVTTVVSTNVAGQIVIDAGQKAFTSYPPTPHGYCLEHPEISIKGMSVEHGHVDITASEHRFSVGEMLSWIPLHGGMTTNLHERLFVVKADEVVDEWTVDGRGRAQ